MGHEDYRTTAKHYIRGGMLDTRSAVKNLPSVWGEGDDEYEQIRATGTDGPEFLALILSQKAGLRCHPLTYRGRSDLSGDLAQPTDEHTPELRKSLTAGDLAPIGGALSPAVTGGKEKRPHGDSNPGLQDENLIS